MVSFSSDGVLRAATTSLRIRGETNVVLRLSAPATNGNDGEQLGLCTPQFSDTPLWPAAWRKAGQNDKLLVGAEGIAVLMGTGDFASAESLFESAVGVIVADVLYTIQSSSAITAAGLPCAYCLTVQGPVRN